MALRISRSISRCKVLSFMQICENRFPVCRTTNLRISQVRCYAKGRNKEKKDSKKPGGKHYFSLGLDKNVLDMNLATTEIVEAMDLMKEAFVTQLALRFDLRAYEQLAVTLEDGSTKPLQQLGTIRKKPTFLEVSLTLPEYQKPVKLAIEKSGLNVTPQQEQHALIIPLPRVTREHREQLVKKADLLLHQCTDRLNGVYRKYEKVVQDQMAAGTAPKDDIFAASQALLELKNSAVQQAKELTKQKKKQLMEETL